MLEAVATFPGIDKIISVTVPRGHGITPDVITIEMVPQKRVWQRIGALQLFYGNQRIVLPDCLTDECHFSFDERGEVWQLRLWDYRWRWQKDNDLHGRYNVRLADGPVDRLDPLTEKEIRLLRRQCARAITLPRGKVFRSNQGGPPEQFPEVYWSYANAAVELQKLCELSGLRIVPQFDGNVDICEAGKNKQGRDPVMPGKGWPVDKDQQSYDPPEVPEKLVLVCGANRYQYTFPLEAVGDDIDGLVKPIDQLSYKPPSEGWTRGDFERFSHVPLVADLSKWYNLPNPRELAKASVYRKYRIRVIRTNGQPFVEEYIGMGKTRRGYSRGIHIPGSPCTVKDVRQILPLGSELLEPVRTAEGWFKTTPVIIWGQFARGSSNNIAIPDDAPEDLIPYMVVRSRHPVWGYLQDPLDSTVLQPEDFQIDFENGIVTINGPTHGRIYRYYENSGSQFAVKPARLWMRGTCQVKEWGTWVPVRSEVAQDPPPGAGETVGGKLYIQDRELFLRVVPEYDATKIALKNIKDNWNTLRKEGRKRLTAESEKLYTRRPASTNFIGWLKVELDGGVQQVVYQLSQSGAFTHVSLHNEFFVQTLSYEERRFLIKTAEERSDARQKALLDLIREKDQPFSRLSGVTRGGR